MDSMVNHYTANIRLRSDDAFTAGGKAGFRPDYATTIYSQILKKLYPDIPVVLGGIEASLRRFTHYDYWSNSLKKSILVDSNADLLIYGNGEFALVELINKLKKNIPFSEISNLNQSAVLLKSNFFENNITENEYIKLHSYEECLKDKRKFAENFAQIETQSNLVYSKKIIEPVGDKILLVNPPILKSQKNKLTMFLTCLIHVCRTRNMLNAV
jgi:uncharacterized radical SAM protein YgiQ